MPRSKRINILVTADVPVPSWTIYVVAENLEKILRQAQKVQTIELIFPLSRSQYSNFFFGSICMHEWLPNSQGSEKTVQLAHRLTNFISETHCEKLCPFWKEIEIDSLLFFRLISSPFSLPNRLNRPGLSLQQISSAAAISTFYPQWNSLLLKKLGRTGQRWSELFTEKDVDESTGLIT